MAQYLQLQRTATDTVPVGKGVVFDAIPLASAGSDFTYNPVVGEITLNSLGLYHVQWSVTPQTGHATDGSGFAIQSADGSVNIGGSSHVKIAQTSGFAIIDIDDTQVGLIIRLVNIADQPVTLSTITPITASLAIFKIEGEQGPPGLQGATGVEGPQGPPGSAGTNGTNGADGIQGATGAQGPQGLKGDPGTSGLSLNMMDGIWIRDLGTGALYKLDGSTSRIFTDTNELDAFVVEKAPNSYDLYFHGIDGTDWTIVMDWGGTQGPQGNPGADGLQGPPGPQGPPGQAGATGSTGPTGLRGATGSTGPQGPPGPTQDLSPLTLRLDNLETITYDQNYHEHDMSLPVATPGFAGLSVGHLRVFEYFHNYFGTGALLAPMELVTGAGYFMIAEGGCAALNLYQGSPTFVQGWVVDQYGMEMASFPIEASHEGIMFIWTQPTTTLPAGAMIKFTLPLILFPA